MSALQKGAAPQIGMGWIMTFFWHIFVVGEVGHLGLEDETLTIQPPKILRLFSDNPQISTSSSRLRGIDLAVGVPRTLKRMVLRSDAHATSLNAKMQQQHISAEDCGSCITPKHARDNQSCTWRATGDHTAA